MILEKLIEMIEDYIKIKEKENFKTFFQHLLLNQKFNYFELKNYLSISNFLNFHGLDSNFINTDNSDNSDNNILFNLLININSFKKNSNLNMNEIFKHISDLLSKDNIEGNYNKIPKDFAEYMVNSFSSMNIKKIDVIFYLIETFMEVSN